MNIEHLHEFLEVVKTQNFTEAASNKNLTQPALSKHISTLEREYNASFFVRSRRGVDLTEEGRLFFEFANRIVSEDLLLREKLALLKDNLPLRIGADSSDTDIATHLSLASMVYRNKYKKAVSYIKGIKCPIQALSDGVIDVFMGYVNPEEAKAEGLRCEPFNSQKLLVLLGMNHPLSSKASIKWSDLKNQRLLKFVSELVNSAWLEIERKCLRNGFVPLVRPVSASSEAEFFGTPLLDDALIWKCTQRQVSFLLETEYRVGIPIEDEDNELTAYAVFKPEDEALLSEYLEIIEEVALSLDHVQETL